MPLLDPSVGAASFASTITERRNPMPATRGPRFTVVDVDTTQQRREIGYRKPVDMAKHLGNKNRQRTMEGIARIAQQGTHMGRIEEYDDARQRLSQLGRRAFEMFNDKEFEVGLKPKSRIDIQVREVGPIDVFA